MENEKALKNIQNVETSEAILGTEDGNAKIQYEDKDGNWHTLTRERYERIKQIASYRVKNYSVPEIKEKMKDQGYSLNRSNITDDLRLIKQMEIFPMNRDAFETALTNFIETSKVAKKRFWEISDREYEKDGNPFATIKAARHAFRTDREVLQTLANLGFKVEELKSMKQGGGTNKNNEDIEQAVEEKLSALGIEDLGELTD